MLKKIAIRAITLFFALMLCLLLLELTLRTGVFDRKDSPNPVWIPHKFMKVHKETNRRNWQYAKLNPYRFTDKVRKFAKEDGFKRIAVIGDSFIWGYGLPYEQVWSHKLEKMIINKYKNFEVMSWGQNASSTIDEISFLEKHGIQYDIDMLIVGWVDNDPDMGDFKVKTYSWHKNIAIKTLKVFFPNAISFLIRYTNKFLTTYFYTDHLYDNWMKRLYSDENIHKYLDVLRDISIFSNSLNIKLLFVLTPQRYDDSIREEFNKIIPLLEQANIKYLNLFPAVKKDLGHINPRKLWANPGDGHPGSLLTDLYAKYVFSYLEEKGMFLHERVSRVQLLLDQYKRNNKNIAAIEALLNIALSETDWDIRKEAAVALGQANDSRVIDYLVAAFNDKNPNIRAAAADALGEINNPHTVESLVKALKDEDNHVRKRAVLALGKKKDLRIIDSLITTAVKDNDQYVRRYALLVIPSYKYPRVVECLIQGLNDPFFFNRKTAIIALGKTMDKRAVKPLIALLSDESSDIRAEAVEALGNIKDPRSIEVLKATSLKDKHPYVRDLAADAIKKITGKNYGKYRRKLLRMWQML